MMDQPYEMDSSRLRIKGRHDGRVIDQAFHATEAFSQREQAAFFEERARGLKIALDKECHDSAAN